MNADHPTEHTASRTTSVCAVVLTYNRPHLLENCLATLRAQSRPPETILVIDNASTDNTSELLRTRHPDVTVLTLTKNVGASGGFVEGIREALALGHDWLWLMDDDAFPRPDALVRLLDHQGTADVLVPWQCNRAGELYGAFEWHGRPVVVPPASVTEPRDVDLFAFIGPLVSRGALTTHGLPHADYFTDFFDWEYALRLSLAGRPARLVPQSVIDHDIGQQVTRRALARTVRTHHQPAWKQYYDARNHLLTVQRLRLGPVALAWFAYIQVRKALSDLTYERDRWQRLRLRAHAIRDGWRGRSGERSDLASPSTHKPAGLTSSTLRS